MFSVCRLPLDDIIRLSVGCKGNEFWNQDTFSGKRKREIHNDKVFSHSTFVPTPKRPKSHQAMRNFTRQRSLSNFPSRYSNFFAEFLIFSKLIELSESLQSFIEHLNNFETKIGKIEENWTRSRMVAKSVIWNKLFRPIDCEDKWKEIQKRKIYIK